MGRSDAIFLSIALAFSVAVLASVVVLAFTYKAPPCLAWESKTVMLPVPVGKISTMQPRQVTRCVKQGPK